MTMRMRTNVRFTAFFVPLVFATAGALWLVANQGTSAETTPRASQAAQPVTTSTPEPTATCPPQWKIQSSPNGSSPGSSLNGMVSLAINNVWAVGATSTNSTSQTLIEHWDGTS